MTPIGYENIPLNVSVLRAIGKLPKDERWLVRSLPVDLLFAVQCLNHKVVGKWREIGEPIFF